MTFVHPVNPIRTLGPRQPIMYNAYLQGVRYGFDGGIQRATVTFFCVSGIFPLHFFVHFHICNKKNFPYDLAHFSNLQPNQRRTFEKKNFFLLQISKCMHVSNIKMKEEMSDNKNEATVALIHMGHPVHT